MHIKDVIADPKGSAAYARRRTGAVVQHGKGVLATGTEAAKSVATVAVHGLKSAVQLQVATLTDNRVPLTQRVRKLKRNAITLATTTRADITAAVKDGYASVTDRLAHVADVTHKEQAIENKISRKAKKIKKAAEQLSE